MLVLGVDPGNEESAWIIYKSDGTICAFEKEANEKVLWRMSGLPTANAVHPFNLQDMCSGLAAGWSLDHMAIEMIASYGMAVGQTTFDTCVWIGRFIQAWGGKDYTQVFRKKHVTPHICHNARANDSNIRAALIDKFGPPGTKKNPGKTYGISQDVWSALAIAVTYAEGGCNK
jgi:hypothetical protein